MRRSLWALSEGIPLRGGLQVGPAVELFPQEIYGAPLLDAYQLESKIAEYPRTAVSPDLFGYLQYLEQLSPDTKFNVHASQKARQCRRLICAAPDDKHPMLHMLSQEVSDAAPEYDKLRVPAYKWVVAQVERYQKERNAVMAGRYSRLALYFETYMR